MEPLGPEDSEALRTLLTRDISHNLYLLGLWEEFGMAPRGEAQGAFYGRSVDGALSAALFVGGTGGLVVPSASDGADVAELSRALKGHFQLESALGEKAAVDALLRAIAVRPRLCAEQRLFSVSADDLGPFTNPTLRLATAQDVPQLQALARAAVEERLRARFALEDVPLEALAERVERRVKCGRTYVLSVEGRLVFKIDVGSRSQYGAELEGLYTLPAERRMGHATLSLGQISRHLLSSLPRLTLRVDEDNGSLARIAQKVGYVAKRSMRVVLA